MIPENSSSILENFSEIPGISTLIKVASIAGVVVIVYIIFLIIKSITSFRKSRQLGTIMRDVHEINIKIDALVNSKKFRKKQD